MFKCLVLAVLVSVQLETASTRFAWKRDDSHNIAVSHKKHNGGEHIDVEHNGRKIGHSKHPNGSETSYALGKDGQPVDQSHETTVNHTKQYHKISQDLQKALKDTVQNATRVIKGSLGEHGENVAEVGKTVKDSLDDLKNLNLGELGNLKDLGGNLKQKLTEAVQQILGQHGVSGDVQDAVNQLKNQLLPSIEALKQSLSPEGLRRMLGLDDIISRLEKLKNFDVDKINQKINDKIERNLPDTSNMMNEVFKGAHGQQPLVPDLNQVFNNIIHELHRMHQPQPHNQQQVYHRSSQPSHPYASYLPYQPVHRPYQAVYNQHQSARHNPFASYYPYQSSQNEPVFAQQQPQPYQAVYNRYQSYQYQPDASFYYDANTESEPVIYGR